MSDPTYDEEHYDVVNSCVGLYSSMTDNDDFLSVPFAEAEVHKAINRLHLKKASGYDHISTNILNMLVLALLIYLT